jgi:carbon monoxide dehydrogenase subunit G
MDMNGTQRIEASREKVYAALNDVDVLKQCIPGCETIEKLSDAQMRATVTLKVGPVKASFKGMVTLSDLDPPNGYTITGEGSGGPAGFAKGGASVKLVPDGEATILEYTAKADIGGKLAQLGSRLIDGTARKLTGDFFEKFGAIVGAPAEPEAEAMAAAVLADDEAAPAPAEKKDGWLRKVFSSSGALLLAFGLCGHACCLGGRSHTADAGMQWPICKTSQASILANRA